jgi:hypothetical protein
LCKSHPGIGDISGEWIAEKFSLLFVSEVMQMIVIHKIVLSQLTDSFIPSPECQWKAVQSGV